jgi:hypothetical protein
MRVQRLLVAALIVGVSAVLAGTSSAQGVMDPGASSSHQYIDAESPTIQSETLSIAIRPGLWFMGLTTFWSQAAWVSASPVRVPSMLAVHPAGDRRWGLR